MLNIFQDTISKDIEVIKNMNDLNLDTEAKKLLLGGLRDGMFYLFCYIILWFLFNKFIKNPKIKAIILGLVTPFFFYYSSVNLWAPLSVLLVNVLQIDPVGLISGLLFFLLKPLSFISGILVFLYLFNKK